MRRRVHLPPERIGEGRAELTPAARHYLVDVLRLAEGDEVELFDGRGRAWAARLAPGLTALALGAPRPGARGGPPVALLPALAKGEKLDLVVEKATELGVALVAPWAAARSVVRLDPARGAERAERWRRVAEAAARQCGRADVPAVRPPAPLAEALRSLPDGAALVALHGAAAAPLAGLPLGGAPGLALVVGPEGGLTDEERAVLRAAGAVEGRLGPRTLRAETAAIAGLAVLQAIAGDLGADGA